MMSESATSYAQEFDPKTYLHLYANVKGNPDEQLFQPFHRQQLRSFYTNYSSKWDNKTARLLEFSGGASLIGVMCAVPYVDQIIFSAHTEQERKEIELWKFEKEGAHNWSDLFKFAVNLAVDRPENVPEDDKTTEWRDRETLLRQRIAAIIGCDILQDYPLSTKQDPFDIISTNYCLECTSQTYSEYKVAIKKLVSLLKPGGFLTMFADECGTFYMVGEKRWHSLYLTMEQGKEALVDAGMTVLVAERMEMDRVQNFDHKATFFVAAQKVQVESQ